MARQGLLTCHDPDSRPWPYGSLTRSQHAGLSIQPLAETRGHTGIHRDGDQHANLRRPHLVETRGHTGIHQVWVVPGCVTRICSQDPFPGCFPRMHFQDALPGCTPSVHSQDAPGMRSQDLHSLLMRNPSKRSFRMHPETGLMFLARYSIAWLPI